MTDFLMEAQAEFGYTQALRRDFHRYPELGFHEVRTAGIVARELTDLGLEIKTGIAETGVVGLLEGAQPGPVVLLRFDMDALPIQEETGAPYSSQNQGVMHACGHDGHTAIGLSVARLLARHQQSLAGTVKFIFQPAEEGLGGAERMLAEGILEDPIPDLALSMHLWNEMPVGVLGITPGPMMAAGDFFRVRVYGRGGHGALPHLTIDPVIAAAHIITALQSIPSRNVPPLEAAVISVTTLKAGEAFNVIPSLVELNGTIRSFKPEIRDVVIRRFAEILENIGLAFGCKVEHEVIFPTPAVVNDPHITAQVLNTARQVFPRAEFATNQRLMVSEDMAYILERVPGAFLLVGSANADDGKDAPHHHPRFDIDENALVTGTALIASATAQFLS